MEGDLKVQYFERARFELHPTNARLPGYKNLDKAGQLRLLVQLTLLGAPLADAHHWLAAAPPPAGADARWFPETQHTLRGAFRAYSLCGALLTAPRLGVGSLLLSVRRWAAPLAFVYSGLAVGKHIH